MNRFNLIFIFLFLTAIAILANADAAKSQASKTISKTLGTWKVTTEKPSKSRGTTLVVSSKDSHKPLMSFTLNSKVDEIVDVDTVTLEDYDSPLLVAVINTGIHGQTLMIFDPSLKKNALLSAISSFKTLSYTVDGDHLSISLFDSPSDVEETTVDWLPGVQVGVDDEIGKVTTPEKSK